GFHGGTVALRVDLDRRPGGITLPKGVTSVNIMGLFGKLMTGFRGSSPFGSAPATVNPAPSRITRPPRPPRPTAKLAQLQQCMQEMSKYPDISKVPADVLKRCSNLAGAGVTHN